MVLFYEDIRIWETVGRKIVNLIGRLLEERLWIWETVRGKIVDLVDCLKKDYVNYTKGHLYQEYLNSAMKDPATWPSPPEIQNQKSRSPPFGPA